MKNYSRALTFLCTLFWHLLLFQDWNLNSERAIIYCQFSKNQNWCGLFSRITVRRKGSHPGPHPYLFVNHRGFDSTFSPFRESQQGAGGYVPLLCLSIFVSEICLQGRHDIKTDLSVKTQLLINTAHRQHMATFRLLATLLHFDLILTLNRFDLTVRIHDYMCLWF